ncbi:MAG: glycosyltransferase, partial [Cyclobacteriaceae bacterium]|nr:glycosyltransferase [Cyclobacteriaceae bacterium]
MYLQKPVLMVPVEGQYEQACNAIDGELAGAGIRGSSFDVSSLLDFLPDYKPNRDFHHWVDKAESVFLEELTNL